MTNKNTEALIKELGLDASDPLLAARLRNAQEVLPVEVPIENTLGDNPKARAKALENVWPPVEDFEAQLRKEEGGAPDTFRIEGVETVVGENRKETVKVAESNAKEAEKAEKAKADK